VTEYPRHLPTFNYVGLYRYFLTFCTFERNPHFTTSANVDLVHAQILRAALPEHFAILVYCYMPDHLHVLVEAERDECDLKPFIARAKQYSGFYFKKTTRQRLWQRYGYERVLRNDEETIAVARYIVENPVRAGIVAAPLDYAFWGSSTWLREELLEYVRRAG
jgi:putative transposase